MRPNCFSKIQLVGQKISRLNIFRKLKLEISPILPQSITNMASAFRH